ncbi:alpha N-terminal protein methyltransferase 1 [Hordeum vulgare subsp. vulgare]|uniref:Alpha N-terminal protein methyltransferase 1 n=1 Tax=Hordeum vulgare subsp. vulgare TaxID=112509 RepID=A0A8I6XT52_HORVV|nr:alpha N-terminal protein methyltransferase 1 [Hordeum vulgare subsp. vulgare]
MDSRGFDSAGREFSSATEMWAQEIGATTSASVSEVAPSAAAPASNGDAGEEAGGEGKREEWYSKAIAYWQGVEASTEGVLGGYGCVNDADVKGSDAFLRPLLAERFGAAKRHLVALDCGSGIGRVTKNFLIRHFNEVDLVEPVAHFLEAARENLSNCMDVEHDTHKAVNFYCIPLQDFTPEEGRYDVIWIQWCIGQLTDDDFISFFTRAKVGLKPDGFFVLKENIAKNGFVLDKEDNSVTRSDAYFRELFNKCGLYIHNIKNQKELPEELFAVRMYALVTSQPKVTKNGKRGRSKNMPRVIRS